MNRFSIGKILCIIGALIIGFCLIGLLGGRSDTNPSMFWGAVAGMVIGLCISAVGLIIAYKPSRAEKDKKSIYKTYLPEKAIDYQRELIALRANFAADSNPKKNRIFTVNYPGSKGYYDFSVIGSGRIYYSYLVEANEELFQDKKSDPLTLPAVVVYSTEEYFEKNPLALKQLAKHLYDNRKSNGWAGEILRNERNYFSNLRVPSDFAEGHEVYMTTIMIYRKHLPLGYLSDSLLPIIADPLSKTAVFVADVKYWTKPLIGNFVHGKATEYKE